MHNKKYLVTIVFILFGLAPAYAQESAPSSPDEQHIRESIESYCDAFNSGDIGTLLSFWADNADYIDDVGETHRGKEAIGELFQAAAEELKDHQLALTIDKLRLVKPDVAIEDGIASLTMPDGETSSRRHTAVWIKNGDKWVIDSARELPSDDVEAADLESVADYLAPLERLVGEWVSEDNGPRVSLTAEWALDKRFLVLEYAVTGKAGSDFRVVEWIGFDPMKGQVKSWTFDSRGGYGEGLWSREDDNWQVYSTGVLPDGRTGTARIDIYFTDDAHWELRSTERDVEGQPLPDVEVQFVRSDATESADSP